MNTKSLAALYFSILSTLTVTGCYKESPTFDNSTPPPMNTPAMCKGANQDAVLPGNPQFTSLYQYFNPAAPTTISTFAPTTTANYVTGSCNGITAQLDISGQYWAVSPGTANPANYYGPFNWSTNPNSTTAQPSNNNPISSSNGNFCTNYTNLIADQNFFITVEDASGNPVGKVVGNTLQINQTVKGGVVQIMIQSRGNAGSNYTVPGATIGPVQLSVLGLYACP